MFEKVGIIGLGLMGGSLAKAFRNRLGVKRIVALNRHSDVLEQAKAEGVIDEFSTEDLDIFRGCDIVFICAPVRLVADYAKKLAPYVGKDCVITDVGSTKSGPAEKIPSDVCYVGGHPMTGSEKFRYYASREHLFENAYYVLTPNKNVSDDKVEKLKKALCLIGAIPVVISPQKHDYAVAAISHAPHIIAAALAKSVKALDDDENHMRTLAAGGFRDTTRIAASSPEMWRDICLENSENILKTLDKFEEIISGVKAAVKAKDETAIYDFFSDAKAYRDTFDNRTPASYDRRFELAVDILDKPGAIAIITVALSSNAINIKNMSILNSRERDEGALYLAFNTIDERAKALSLLAEMGYSAVER